MVNVVSKGLQDIVQQGLTDKGFSPDSNVVVIAKYWTNLLVQTGYGAAKGAKVGAAGGPVVSAAGASVGALSFAAETSLSTIIEMAVQTNASLNQNLTNIDWNIATNIQQQQQLVQKLQAAQNANNSNLVAHYEAGLKSATESLIIMYAAKKNIQNEPLMWLSTGG